MGEKVLVPKYKWSNRNKKWLRLLIENELIVKVHAYRKKNPCFVVDPRDTKTNIQRFPIGYFEELRKQGVFYEPTMGGHWYYFFLKEDVKEDAFIFQDGMTASECNIVTMLRKGMTAKRTKGVGNYRPLCIFDGDEYIGRVEGNLANFLVDKGWLAEDRDNGEETLYKFVDLHA